jgi:exodeoxyribonuclease VII small subunit
MTRLRWTCSPKGGKVPVTMTDSAAPDRDPAKMTYEEALEAVENIFERIESGDAGFEESITLYERGRALLARCRAVLDQAEKRLTELDAKTLDPSDEE